MEKWFKHIVILVVLLFSGSNSLFSNNLHPLPCEKLNHKTVYNFLDTNLSDDDFNFYSSSLLLIDVYLENGVISDTSEDDVQNSNFKKNLPPFKSVCFSLKQQVSFISSLPKSRIFSCFPVFFQSKTASSLYLIFEVFRI